MMKTAWPLALLTTLVPGLAFAQPGASETEPPDSAGLPVIVTPAASAPIQVAAIAAPAPQNESWNNVSHINGQVVKVGERGDYLYKWKTTTISTNPIGWLIGIYGASVSHAVHDNIALRVDANLFSIEDTEGYEVGVSAPIYLRRVFQGPFLEPGLMVRRLNDKDCDVCESASVGPEVMFGWHWTFDSGLNAAMAFGLMRDVNAEDTGDLNVEPAGYFRVGYAF